MRSARRRKCPPENKRNNTLDWLEDIGKLLPIKQIYKDAAQPAVRQVGQALEKTVKAARFALAPIEYLAAQNDRYQRYLERVANKVPEERLMEAHPQLVGPIFDNLRYVEEDSMIAELFVNLLARAIDKERVHEAHPAFVHIIAQLSPDEAVILFHLKKQLYTYRQHAQFHRETNTFAPRTLTENTFPIAELVFPQNFSIYMDHLHSLDLAGIWQQGNQEVIFEGEPRVQTGVSITSVIALTSFGQLFANACVPDEIPGKLAEPQNTKK